MLPLVLLRLGFPPLLTQEVEPAILNERVWQQLGSSPPSTTTYLDP